MLLKRIISLLVVVQGFAGTAQINFTAYKFTQKNQLLSYNIKSIAQDKYGFIWMGTQDGLYFFDGNSFTLINHNAPGLIRDVQQVVYDPYLNCIWVSYIPGGLEAYDCKDHRLRNKVLIDGKKIPEDIQYFMLSDHALIIAMDDGIASIYPQPGDTITNLQTRKMIRLPQIVYMACYAGRTLVSLSEKGLYPFDTATGILGPCLSKYPSPISCQYLDGDNFCYAAKGQVVRHNLLTGMNQSFTTNLEISCVNRWPGGKILLSTANGNYVADPATGSVTELRLYVDGKPDEKDYVITSMWDSKGRLWLGNSKSLEVSILHKPFIFAFASAGTPYQQLDHLYQILPVARDNLLLGDLRGCYHFDSRTGEIRTINATDNTFLLAAAGATAIMYSSNKGLRVIDKDLKISPLGTTFSEWTPYAATSLLTKLDLQGNTTLFAASKDYLFLWDRNKKSCTKIVTSADSGWLDNNVFSLTGLGGDTVLACQTNGLVVYKVKNGRRTTHTFIHPTTNEKIAFFFDALVVDNTIWVATYGSGILVLDRNFTLLDIIDTNKGLSNNGVYKLFKDSLGYTWASTNNGLNRINNRTHHVNSFFQEDGIHYDMFEQYCGTKSGDRIYFGGINGFTAIVPQDLVADTGRPEVFVRNIEYIRTGSTEWVTSINAGSIFIANDISQTNVFLSSSNLVKPGKNRFYYKIAGIHGEWVSLGNQNKISIFGLPPAEYQLDIRTMNAENEQVSEKQVLLIVAPKWYQTGWFKLLLVLSAAGIIFLLYRYRVHQIEQQHAIRKGIATDLHDDFGSTLNSVKIFVSLAMRGINPSESLKQVNDNLNEATQGLRDMIWVLDDSLDTVGEMAARLRRYALPVAEANGTHAIILADDSISQLPLEKKEKRNLFLVCKEAINNSFKYASASELKVIITASGKKIMIIIEDNGQGFDSVTVRSGYGLKNMVYRTEQIGYQFVLASTAGEGTRIQIKPH